MVCLAGELYLHVVLGQLLAYQIGYYKMDTVLMLPLVELIIAVERFFPTIQRQCQVPSFSCFSNSICNLAWARGAFAAV